MLDKELPIYPQSRIVDCNFREIAIADYGRAIRLFNELMEEIDFQRTKKEGKAIRAQLLVWTAEEIAKPYYKAFQENGR